MKIQIELVEAYGRTARHLRTVADYISDKIIFKAHEGFLGTTIYNADIKPIGGRSGGIDWGKNIGTQDTKIFCHLSKTKGGVFKIKVWGE